MFDRKDKLSTTIKKTASVLVILSLLCPPQILAQTLPSIMPGNILATGQIVQPVLLKGIQLNLEDPFQFEFIIDAGDTGLRGDELKDEASRLIKYFFAALTVPDDDFWVNLSPYEQEKIIPDTFGKTVLGRDLLAQDYVLKQLMASLLHPDGEFGKQFWGRIYEKAFQMYGTTEIALDTFNKVWVIPDKAVIYSDHELVYAIENHFKVMLDSDYHAMNSHVGAGLPRTEVPDREVLGTEVKPARTDQDMSVSNEIIREIIIPEIEREVNEGEYFAPLRQIGSSVMLATWYKINLREGILANTYIDQNKVQGVDTKEQGEPQRIYDQYIDVFRRGAFNYIKEEYDPYTNTIIPRKYFSGGAMVKYQPVLTDTENRRRLDSVIPEDSAQRLYRVNVTSSPITPKDQDPWKFMDLKTILDDPDRREYGDKTVILAQFLDHLKRSDVTFGTRKPADLVPELFILSQTQTTGMSERASFSDAQRQGLKRHLGIIGQSNNLTFGDVKRPLLVAVRTAPDLITPGMFLSVLNVGINDQTVEGLVDVFSEYDVTPENARQAAYALYAKLIKDFLAEIPNSSGKKFPRGQIQELFDEHDLSPQEKVWILKGLYQEHFGNEFPQDEYQQLNMIIKAIPAVTHYGMESESTRHHAIIVQRMVIGSLVNERFSGAGELTSRDPASGDRKLAGNLERGKQGDTTTGQIRDLSPEDWEQINGRLADFYNTLLEEAELFLKGAARIETTVENGVPHLLQLRRMEKSDNADVKILWDLLSLWREDERRGIPEEDRRGLSPDEAFERGKQYLTTTSLRKQQKIITTSEHIPLGKGVVVSHGAASGYMVMGLQGARQMVNANKEKGGDPDKFILFQREIGAAAKPILEHPDSLGAAAFDQVGAHVESLTRTYNIPGLVGIELDGRFDDIVFDYTARKIIFKGEDGADIEIHEGTDYISIGEDGTIYKGKAEVVSENRSGGMSKEAAQFIIFLLEHQGQNATIKIQVNAWDGTSVNEIDAQQFQYRLDRINNPGHKAWGRDVPTYGPIIDVAIEFANQQSAEAIETREISDEVIQMAADHVIREAQVGFLDGEVMSRVSSQTLSNFIYSMWHYYSRLDLADYEYREQQAGRTPQPYLPSNIKYSNIEQARMKYFLAVSEGAEDTLARSIYHWVERHKVAAFTFKKGIFPNLPEEKAQSLFGKMIKYGIQEGGYRAVDFMFIRILAEMIALDRLNGTTLALDRINGLEPINIFRRSDSDPKKFVTVSISAEEQMMWIFAGLHAFYFDRHYQQHARDKDLPTIAEVSEFLQMIRPGEKIFDSGGFDDQAPGITEILDSFKQGEDAASSSPMAGDNLGGVDLRSYDKLLKNRLNDEIDTNGFDMPFDADTVIYGIMPVISGITPITNLQMFNLN